MAARKNILIDGVPVVFEKRPRARSVRISVRATKGVRVAVPPRVSFEEARRATLGRREWIRTTLRRIERARERRRDAVAAAERLDRAAARAYLADRLDRLAAEHGYAYKRLSVRVQGTLWGSASAAGRIQLNARLAAIPPELCDYVILHELAHTRHAGHGRLFWRELERHVPQARRLRMELRDYSLALF